MTNKHIIEPINTKFKLVLGSTIFLLLLIIIGGFLLTPKSKNESISTNSSPVLGEKISPVNADSPSIKELPKSYSVFKGSYSIESTTTLITLNIPQEGTILGSVEGACQGAIAGIRNAEKIEGSGKGTCKIGTDIHSEVKFNGTLSQENAVIVFEGKAGVLTHKDTMGLKKE